MPTHSFLQRIVFSSFAIFATLTVSDVAMAQGNNWHNTPHMTTHSNPPSVTSFGFGGQPGFHGMPASVTSPNFNGTPFQFNQPPLFFEHRHHDRGFARPFYNNVIAVPYAYPVYVQDPGVDDSMEEDYRGGPTVFDRRGPGSEEYGRTERRERDFDGDRTRDRDRDADRNTDLDEDYRTEAPAESQPQAEVSTQPRTVLVFKDGRQLEILNYAIVGPTLYDLSDGLARKMPLAELDLAATVKQNDDRGVGFQLPAGAKSN